MCCTRLTVLSLAIVFCAAAEEQPHERDARGTTGVSPVQPPIRLTNYKDGEVIRYPVPLIRGALSDPDADSITVVNTTSNRETRELKGLAHKGQFKALTELLPGVNKLLLRSGKNELPLTLEYKPQTNSYFVRAIYLTDNTGATEYQTPLEKDPQDYAAKLDTMMKLLQTFTAERLNDLGFGRLTFNLELDEQGKVKVQVFRCAAPAEKYYQMPDQIWYGNIAGQLEKPFPTAKAKNLVVAAYTRYDPAIRKAKGHTALGGGGQALFGSGNMFTWPSSLAEVQPAFMNATRIDTARMMSDSVGRHTFWAAASTTIGACLHELCHTFGLPHTKEPLDIMTRGIDQFNRVFTFMDPVSATNKKEITFPETRVACFPPISAAALAPCPWLALDDRAYDDRARIAVRLDEPCQNLVIESDKDIRYVGFDVKGDAVYFSVPDLKKPEEARRMSFELASLLKNRLKTDEFSIRVINDQGVIKHESSLVLFNGPFVLNWQFASLTEPWRNTNVFVQLSAERIAELGRNALSAKLAPSTGSFVDFLPQFPENKRAYVAGYAARVIKSGTPRQIKLFTGSDDALRVWLNGKLLKEVLALRAATVDAESFTAELQAGDNTLLVEVSQGLGGWGLFLRLESMDGKHLRLEDNGTLTEAPAIPKLAPKQAEKK